MAEFKTHLTGGVLIGATISLASYSIFSLDIIQTLSIFILGSLSGVLPDLDHDSGKPLALLFSIVSVLVPALLLHLVPRSTSLTPEFLICYFSICYLIINYFICAIIKKITVHRGIMHSIPFSLLFAEMAYLLFVPSGKLLSAIISFSVFIGCITHLLLDEFHSISFKFGILPTLKRSSGTALKLTSENRLITLFTYCLIIALGYVATAS